MLQALEIKPEERKLKVAQSAVFTVKLRETATEDIEVALSLSDPAVLTLAESSVIILRGMKTADFSATGIKIGTATITAETSNGKASSFVKVGEVSEEENERSSHEIRIAFTPDKLRMKPGEPREVVLLVKPPQKAPVAVDFKVANGLVNLDGTRELGAAAAELKLRLLAGSQEGTDSVVATLPSAPGGGKAELLVEISSKKGGK